MTQLRCAADSHPGRVRENNEDRFHCDLDRGIFLVIDGVGGQAAGEKAADTALSLIRARLERKTGTVEERIREAITAANNEILRVSRLKPEWKGMACVLTVAVAEDSDLTIGHVGDTRLYKLHQGELRKITRDHSPVGEREDSGEIAEIDAMRHPRRNEVYRDVGSEEHTPTDANFIDLHTVSFEPDSAILLCTDGLSDLLTSAEIRRIVVHKAQDPAAVVSSLIEAANEAGGKDNVTALIVEGERFVAAVAPGDRQPTTIASTRGANMSATSGGGGGQRAGLKPGTTMLRAVIRMLLTFLVGVAGGAIAYVFLQDRLYLTIMGISPASVPSTSTRTLVVRTDAPADYKTIGAAVQAARPGDTVLVAPGVYREQVRLKNGVTLMSDRPRGAIVRASTDAALPGVAVIGENIQDGRLVGFRVLGDATEPLEIGMLLNHASVLIEDSEIAGARLTGVEVAGATPATLLGNYIHSNVGAGVTVRTGATPRLSHNAIVRNGREPGRAGPGVDIQAGAQPELTGNVIADNGAEGIWGVPPAVRDEVLRHNIFVMDARANAKGAMRVLPGR